MSVASEIARLQNAKASIKTSIENKGVTVGDGTIDTSKTCPAPVKYTGIN